MFPHLKEGSKGNHGFPLVPLKPLNHYCMPRAKIHNILDLYIHLQKRCDPLSDYTNHD